MAYSPKECYDLLTEYNKLNDELYEKNGYVKTWEGNVDTAQRAKIAAEGELADSKKKLEQAIAELEADKDDTWKKKAVENAGDDYQEALKKLERAKDDEKEAIRTSLNLQEEARDLKNRKSRKYDDMKAANCPDLPNT